MCSPLVQSGLNGSEGSFKLCEIVVLTALRDGGVPRTGQLGLRVVF